MTGAMNKGDAVIACKVNEEKIKVNDVIVFQAGDKVLIHRVIEIEEIDGNETYVYIVKANEAKENTVEKIINNIEIAKNTFVKDILSKIEKMLLNSNIKNENILTENELKYLENVKEEHYRENNTKERNAGIRKNEEINPSKNMYLVPVKKQKKGWFFSKNKKAKRAKESKRERRRMIG